MTQNRPLLHTSDTDALAVVSHAPCIDGTAAALVFYACSRMNILPKKIKYIPARYGHTTDLCAAIGKNFTYMVDFSLPRKELIDLRNHVAGLVVLDHHATAQHALKGLDFCHFDMTRSGAQLALDFAEKHFMCADILEQAYPSLRLLVDYVADRDLWQFALVESELVNSALSTLPILDDATAPEDVFDAWLAYAALPESVSLGRMIHEGSIIKRNTKKVVAMAHTWAVTGQLLGRSELVPIVNIIPQYVSETLHNLLQETDAPYAVGWYFDGTKYTYSLRSRDNFDVSALAKQYGGGGHRTAAGFTSRDFFVRTFAIEVREDIKTKRHLGIAS